MNIFASRSPARADVPTSGCRNEETFAKWTPLAELPPERLFCSASGHGFDVVELAGWILQRRSFVNPHTNTPLSNDDVARLRALPHATLRSMFAALDPEVTQHLAAARICQQAGDWEGVQGYARQALVLAPDHAEAAAMAHAGPGSRPAPIAASSGAAATTPWLQRTFDWMRPSGRAGASAPAADGASSSGAPPQGATGAAASGAAARAARWSITPATLVALEVLAQALEADRSAELSDSQMAVATWMAHADSMRPAERANLDRHVRVFGSPFSVMLHAALTGTRTPAGRSMGITDLGREVSRSLRGLPR